MRETPMLTMRTSCQATRTASIEERMSTHKPAHLPQGPRMPRNFRTTAWPSRQHRRRDFRVNTMLRSLITTSISDELHTKRLESDFWTINILCYVTIIGNVEAGILTESRVKLILSILNTDICNIVVIMLIRAHRVGTLCIDDRRHDTR